MITADQAFKESVKCREDCIYSYMLELRKKVKKNIERAIQRGSINSITNLVLSNCNTLPQEAIQSDLFKSFILELENLGYEVLIVNGGHMCNFADFLHLSWNKK